MNFHYNQSKRKICSEKCSFCDDAKETLTHVLTGCKVALGRGASDPTNRIVYRHDKISKVMVDAIREHVPEEYTTVTVDLKHDSENYASLPQVPLGPLLPRLEMLRPDFVLENDEEVIIGELTSPMEHNMESANEKKEAKYSAVKVPDGDDRDVVVMPFEVGARGGVNRT
ncbi:MAG: hypothetical protein EOP53_13605, partial [Sphingobacteriales bacterium]